MKIPDLDLLLNFVHRRMHVFFHFTCIRYIIHTGHFRVYFGVWRVHRNKCMYLHHTRYITQAISESIVVWRVHRNRFKYLLIVSEYLPHVSSYIHLLSPENCSSIKNNTCAALQFLTLQDIVYIYIYTVYISILSVTFNKSNCGNFYLLAIMPGTLRTEVLGYQRKV